ncbi:DUF932 domain-containing protein [Hoeflea sp.]|uniref:DUF932 domain-containing protein n=1 Tax=Hoeflea sp. TaxID=1940281 RepID=UPI0025C5D92A|nr:DUF932 domain-containing protein [Hoeflea sp.]
MAQQARTRIEGRAEFTKHMLRLRHRSLTNTEGEALEVVRVNANGGTSSYQMIPGFFRFVCANGLMVGDTFGEVKVRHSGNAMGEVIEGAYRVLEDAPEVADRVQRSRAITLQDEERTVLAEAAHMLRFPEAHKEDGKQAPVTADALLTPRRHDDRATDLWTAVLSVQRGAGKHDQGGIARPRSERERHKPPPDHPRSRRDRPEQGAEPCALDSDRAHGRIERRLKRQGGATAPPCAFDGGSDAVQAVHAPPFHRHAPEAGSFAAQATERAGGPAPTGLADSGSAARRG